jgi:hypothetical protein
LYSNCFYSKINIHNIQEVISFYNEYNVVNKKDNPIFQNEAEMTEFVLRHYANFDFLGAFLKINDEFAGFIIGEIQHNILYIHIEKADKNYIGVNEYLHKTYITDILNSYPHLNYVNKEEDVGDEGLRKSKLSYYPIAILNKYNLELL